MNFKYFDISIGIGMGALVGIVIYNFFVGWKLRQINQAFNTVEEPKIEELKVELPKVEEPKIEEPKVELPKEIDNKKGE